MTPLVVAMSSTDVRQWLEPLPVGVELVELDRATPSELERVEFLISGREAGGRIAEMPNLRAIQALSAGVDWLAGRVPEGVVVCNAAGVFDDTLAEWVLSTVLATYRGLDRAWQAGLRHQWEPYVPDQVRGRRITILGYGSIGRAVAARFQPFGVELSFVARTPRPGVHGIDGLDDLLPATDVLVVLLPLTRETNGLLDATRLGRLPHGALVVIGGRGRVVDTSALRALAATGQIRAILDVVDPEPLPPDDPLWSTPGVMITPHIAGDGPDTDERAGRLAGEQLRRFAAGEPLQHRVPPYLLEAIDGGPVSRTD